MGITQLRSKWAAVGAAVAVTLGAGGIGITHATTSSGEMPIYLPIEPCRLADTRPDFQVGDRATPLGAEETYTLDGQGAIGNCNLPSGTAALSLNVTALDASAPTFVSLFPAGAALPVASHLNPLPGQGPTPNAVNVDLSAGGEFSVYNLAGTVNIIIDVVGIFDDHVHTGDDIVDESLTGADIDDNSVSSADTSNESGVANTYNTSVTNLSNSVQRIVGTSIRVPSDGYLVVQVTGNYSTDSNGNAWCQFTKGATRTSLDILFNASPDPWIALDQFDSTSAYSHFSGHTVIEVDVADNPLLFTFGQSIGLDCLEIAGTVTTDDVQITATFHPTNYKPAGLIIIP